MMKYMNYMNIKGWMAVLMLSSSLFGACSDDISIGQVDESKYVTGDGNVMGYISDNYGKRMFTNVDFRTRQCFFVFENQCKVICRGYCDYNL